MIFDVSLRDVLGCAFIFTPWVDVRKSKCYQHIRPDFQGESVGTCRQCLYLETYWINDFLL